MCTKRFGFLWKSRKLEIAITIQTMSFRLTSHSLHHLIQMDHWNTKKQNADFEHLPMPNASSTLVSSFERWVSVINESYWMAEHAFRAMYPLRRLDGKSVYDTYMLTHPLLFIIQSSPFHIHFSIRPLCHHILDSHNCLFVCLCVRVVSFFSDWRHNSAQHGCAETSSLPLIIRSSDPQSFIRAWVQTEVAHLLALFRHLNSVNCFYSILSSKSNPFESLYRFDKRIWTHNQLFLVSPSVSVLRFFFIQS